MKWTDEAKCSLFLHIVSAPSFKANYPDSAIAAHFQSQGYECTAKAVNHFIFKLRKDGAKTDA